MHPAPIGFLQILQQIHPAGNALHALFEEKRGWLENVILGNEGDLPIAISPAKRCLDHVKALLLPRAFRYANAGTDFQDFQLNIAEDSIVSEILRRDRENEVAQLNPRRARGPSEFDEVVAAYQDAVIGFGFKRGVRDPHRAQEIAHNVLMQVRVRFDPLLGSFTGLLFQTARFECLHGRPRNDVPLDPGVATDDDPGAVLSNVMLAVHDDRLRMIAGLSKPAHKLLSFLFNHDLGWKPQRIAKTFGDETIRVMYEQCVDEYAEWLDSDAGHVRSCMDELESKLTLVENGRIVEEKKLAEYLSPAGDREQGAVGRDPGQRINDWSLEVDKALTKAIEYEEADYLSVVFGGAKKPSEPPREILAFAMIRLLGRKMDAGEPYMTEPVYDVLHQQFEPSYLEKNTRLEAAELHDCLRALSDEVALRRGGGLGPVSGEADPPQWHDQARARVRDDLTRPAADGRCRGLLFAFVHGYL